MPTKPIRCDYNNFSINEIEKLLEQNHITEKEEETDSELDSDSDSDNSNDLEEVDF